MTDAELKRYFTDISLQVRMRINVSMNQLTQIIPDPNDARVARYLSVIEEVRQATGFLMVIEYEQNRRANVGALVLP